eukprot:2325178-Amphidinium_carterae.1
MSCHGMPLRPWFVSLALRSSWMHPFQRLWMPTPSNHRISTRSFGNRRSTGSLWKRKRRFFGCTGVLSWRKLGRASWPEYLDLARCAQRVLWHTVASCDRVAFMQLVGQTY